MTLEAGDIIATGTPSGVGFSRTPPEFLQPGDVMESDSADWYAQKHGCGHTTLALARSEGP